MPEFFQTLMGKKFYEADIPRIVRALERIADALQRLESPRSKTPVVCDSCYQDITVLPKSFDPANPMCQDCLDYIAYKESQES